jgi:hypothetical protein
MADCKSRKERLTQIVDESRHKLRSKQVMRSIPCTLYLNFTKLTATTVRLDTGEQVNQRPMNQDERNMLNATPTLWPEKQEEVDDDVDGAADLSDDEPLSEQEANDHAVEMFGQEDDDGEWGMGK